jgi:hypothetical protein
MKEMPETWPGPNGRILTVVKAKVKRDPRNERLGVQLNDGWIVRCGHAGRGCRGIIGYPASHEERILRTSPSWRPSDTHGNSWCLTTRTGYRGTARDGYHVLAENDREPRRPLANMTMPSIDGDPGDDEHYRYVIGQYPIPPCIVYCPNCGKPNFVEPPDAGAPSPNWDVLDDYEGYGWDADGDPIGFGVQQVDEDDHS